MAVSTFLLPVPFPRFPTWGLHVSLRACVSVMVMWNWTEPYHHETFTAPVCPRASLYLLILWWGPCGCLLWNTPGPVGGGMSIALFTVVQGPVARECHRSLYNSVLHLWPTDCLLALSI